MYAIWTGTASQGSGPEVAQKLSDKILCCHGEGKEEAMVWFSATERQRRLAESKGGYVHGHSELGGR